MAAETQWSIRWREVVCAGGCGVSVRMAHCIDGSREPPQTTWVCQSCVTRPPDHSACHEASRTLSAALADRDKWIEAHNAQIEGLRRQLKDAQIQLVNRDLNAGPAKDNHARDASRFGVARGWMPVADKDYTLGPSVARRGPITGAAARDFEATQKAAAEVKRRLREPTPTHYWDPEGTDMP